MWRFVKNNHRISGLIAIIIAFTVFPILLDASLTWIFFHIAFMSLIASTLLATNGHRWSIPIITTQSLVILVFIMSLEKSNEQFVMLFNGSVLHLVISNQPTKGHWKRFVGTYLLLAYVFGVSLAFMGIRIPIPGIVIDFPAWFEDFTPMFVFLIAAIYMHFLGDMYELDKRKSRENEEELTWVRNTISLVSHNIRTPLSAVKTGLDVLKLKLHKEGQSHFDNDFKRLDEASENAEEIVNRLLRISTVQSQTTWQSSSLTERLRKTYPNIQLHDANPDKRFEPKTRIALQLAMECFIDNAIAHGKPPIKVDFDKKGAIRICDRGNGLSPDQLENYGKDNPLLDLSKPLHGVGVSFSIKILESIGWTVTAANTAEGFEISLRPV